MTNDDDDKYDGDGGDDDDEWIMGDEYGREKGFETLAHLATSGVSVVDTKRIPYQDTLGLCWERRRII